MRNEYDVALNERVFIHECRHTVACQYSYWSIGQCPLLIHISDNRGRSYVNENDDDGQSRTWIIYSVSSCVWYPNRKFDSL